MELSPLQQQAIARWNELGATTPTHPVLQAAYDLYYMPFGLAVDALVYDALAALEDRDNAAITLVNPRWNPKKVSKTWSQYNVVEPLIDMSEFLDPLFLPDGTIDEFRMLKDFTFTDENNTMMSTFVQSAEHKKIKEFEEKHAEDIFDLADALSLSTKLYIDAALELILQEGPDGDAYAKFFLENTRQYPAAVFQVITQAQANG